MIPRPLIACFIVLAIVVGTRSGAAEDPAKWTAMAAHEFMLNIVDLPGVELGRAQQRMWKGRVPHHRMRFDGGKSFVRVDHLPDWFYNRRITEKYQDRAEMDRRVSRLGRSRGKNFEATERRKIYSSNERGGWVYAAREKMSGQTCIVSRFAFLTDWRKLGSASGEHYDTLVYFRDCSGRRSLDDVVSWVEGAKIVAPPDNKAR